MDRILPWLVSAVLHLGVLGALLLVPVTAETRRSPTPIQVDLVDLAPPAPPPPVAKPEVPARVAERPRPRPTPSPSRRPRPRPSPSSSQRPPVTPEQDPLAEKLRTLRQLEEFKSWSDEDLKALELPPGMESWEDFVKLAKQLNMLPIGTPPDVGASQPPVLEVTWDHELVGNRHHLIIQAPQGQYWMQWNEGDSEAEGIFYVPAHEGEGQTVRTSVNPDYQAMVDALLQPVPSPS